MMRVVIISGLQESSIPLLDVIMLGENDDSELKNKYIYWYNQDCQFLFVTAH